MFLFAYTDHISLFLHVANITLLTYLVSIHWHGFVQVILVHIAYLGLSCCLPWGEEFMINPSAHPCFGGFEQSRQSLSCLSPLPLSSRHLLGSCPGTSVQVIRVHLPCCEEFITYPSAHPCFGGFEQSRQSLSCLSPLPLSSRHLLGSCSATRLSGHSAIEMTEKI